MLLAALAALGVACSLGIDSSEYAGGSAPAGGRDGGEEAGAATDAGTDAPSFAATDSGGEGGGKPCVAPGDVCADGTVMVGVVGSFVIFTTPCDLGRTASAAGCKGPPTTLPFNDGNSDGAVFVGATSDEDGRSNTAMLVAADANSSVPGVQAHQAAKACATLDFGGHADFFLPSSAEIAAAFEARDEIGGFEQGGGFYWTSTETHDAADPLNAARVRFSDGYAYGDGDGKPSSELVRCFRRGP